MNHRGAATLCLIGATVLGGCGAKQMEGPPPIRYGHTACTECRMLINEERFAASLVTADEAVETFDSVECLLRRLDHHQPERLTRVWVHDYDSAKWLDAQDAWYVQSADIATPMGRGLVAVGTEAAAKRLAAAAHGRVMRFHEIPLSTAQEP